MQCKARQHGPHHRSKEARKRRDLAKVSLARQFLSSDGSTQLWLSRTSILEDHVGRSGSAKAVTALRIGFGLASGSRFLVSEGQNGALVRKNFRLTLSLSSFAFHEMS